MILNVKTILCLFRFWIPPCQTRRSGEAFCLAEFSQVSLTACPIYYFWFNFLHVRCTGSSGRRCLYVYQWFEKYIFVNEITLFVHHILNAVEICDRLVGNCRIKRVNLNKLQVAFRQSWVSLKSTYSRGLFTIDFVFVYTVVILFVNYPISKSIAVKTLILVEPI